MIDRSFLVLLALHRAPSHGYAIKKSVLELSGGTLDLEPGGLYRLIGRLAEGATATWTPASEALAECRGT